MNLNSRPLTPAEYKYSYTQTLSMASITGCVGEYFENIRTDNSRDITGPDLKTEDLRAEFNTILDTLRESILSTPEKIQAYGRAHPENALNSPHFEYGFRIDTEKHAYILRLFRYRSGRKPFPYALVIFCYLRKQLDGYIQRAENGIRFVTPAGEDRFRLQDGDKIRVVTPEDEEMICVCRYIDDYHFEVGGVNYHPEARIFRRPETYHIRQFAERMEQAGNTFFPLE